MIIIWDLRYQADILFVADLGSWKYAKILIVNDLNNPKKSSSNNCKCTNHKMQNNRKKWIFCAWPPQCSIASYPHSHTFRYLRIDKALLISSINLKSTMMLVFIIKTMLVSVKNYKTLNMKFSNNVKFVINIKWYGFYRAKI